MTAITIKGDLTLRQRQFDSSLEALEALCQCIYPKEDCLNAQDINDFLEAKREYTSKQSTFEDIQ